MTYNNGNSFFIEVDSFQLFKHKQIVGGDVFHQHKIRDEQRIISVLSDGLGSGIKANVLATLTSTMAVNFISKSKDIKKTAEVIMRTLPVCKVRKISYSTFTIIDINSSGDTRIIEYDNPPFMLIRNNEIINLESKVLKLNYKKNKENIINYSEFKAEYGDRIIFFSDGVSQSGLGTKKMPLGWDKSEISKFIKNIISKNNNISARQLSKEIVTKAHANDDYKPKDDITSGVIYLRKPRKAIVFTGPPINQNMDAKVVREFESYPGKKIICGGTTAKIVSRELNKPVLVDLKNLDEEVPPCCIMEDVDLITEGTFTLGKVLEILENEELNTYKKENGVTRLLNFFMNSDVIQFVVGTKINQAHQDPNIPVELGIRRNLIKNIAKLLEEKYLKEVSVKFV